MIEEQFRRKNETDEEIRKEHEENEKLEADRLRRMERIC